ncbi:MAG: lytic transglycosylase domain-containing protein, partial [Bacteroidales bacterium]|nr:lytic transglycosylase domain-containing protein [Bacteroidales bacterium]
MISSKGIAQDVDRSLLVSPDSLRTFGSVEQDSVSTSEPIVEVVLEIVAPAQQESFLTRYLRFFDRRFDVTEIIEEDLNYEPLFEGADSVYQARLSQINTLMDLPYNSRVRSYIEVYTSRRRNQTRTMLMLSRYYFPIFEQELKKHEMPEELKYLAIIESALNPRAVSRAGASGLWQFMYRTGRMFGLKADAEIDERFDPAKSTEAAALYLKSLYNTYKCWTLAIAAYNCGPGNVN